MITDPVLLNDWHPVCRESDLADKPVRAARLLGEDIVVWRAGDKVFAWQDLCLHRGAKLSIGKIVNDELMCPYHGWRYGSDGKCTHIPAHPDQASPTKAVVKTYRARTGYGMVWACLGQPPRDLPPFPEWHDASYRKVFCGPYTVDASAPRLVENFLDVAHFPFVHEGYLGVPDHPAIADYEAEITDEGVVAHGVRVYQPNGYGDGKAADVEYTYKALRPLTAYLLKESAGPRFSIILMITPHETVGCTAWMWMAMNYGYDIPERELVEWQDAIFAQDRPVVQSQRPELLPLDLQAELHLRSDRTAIAYRKWLTQLGLQAMRA